MLLSSEQVLQMDGACGSSRKVKCPTTMSQWCICSFFPGFGFNALYLNHTFSSGTCCHVLSFLPPPTQFAFFPTLPLNVDLFYFDSAEVLTRQCSHNHLQTNLYAMISSLGQLTTLQLELRISQMSGWEKTASSGWPLCALTIQQTVHFLIVHFP